MTVRRTAAILALALVFPVAHAFAQPLGTFRWQVQPFGSVLNLNVTQQGSIYLLNGFEAQCGGNASLPAWGIAVAQANGTVFIGLTTITEQGYGLHTRATIFLSTFSGTWVDNANQSGTFQFNPGQTCPGGPRISPIHPDAGFAAWPDAATTMSPLETLRAEMEDLRKRLADLESKKP
jgi:hypothetical protein